MRCMRCKKAVIIGGAPALPPEAEQRVDASVRVRGVDVVTRCSPAFAPLAESLMARFERSASVNDGDVFAWGPIPVFLRSEGAGLRVCEPDMRLKDARARPNVDLTNALSVNAFLGQLHEHLGVEASEFTLMNLLLTFGGALDMPKVHLFRKFPPHDLPNGSRESGWYLGPNPNELATLRPDGATREDYKLEMIFELYHRRPLIVAALGLPMQFIALIEGNRVTHVVDPRGDVAWTPAAGKGS